MPYGGSVQVSSKLRKGTWDVYDLWVHWCPACQTMHQFRVAKNGTKSVNPGIPDWSFNGNLIAPTFTPSMLITIPEHKDMNNVVQPRKVECHYILTDGVINYCGNCPHEMKGQSVPLPDLPEEYQN